MLRKIAAGLAGAVVAATLAVSGAATPANADVCVGSGTAHTSVAVPFLPGTAANATFTFGLSTPGICQSGGNLTANGTLNAGASCIGGSTGSGTINGKPFTFQVVGAVLVAQGGVTAAAIILPDARTGDLCTPIHSADDFVLVGAAVI